MIDGKRQLRFGLLTLAVVCTFVEGVSEAAIWEQGTWRSTVYYRNTFETDEAFSAFLHVAAVDSYEVYLNGVAVGADSVGTRMQKIAVDVEDGDNDIAVRVVNRGTGAGNGVMMAVVPDTAAGAIEDSLFWVETATDRSRQTWFWTAEPLEGSEWTTADASKDEAWNLVQQGAMDTSIENVLDPPPEVVAGYSGDVDIGSVAGGIVLKQISGENLALDRVSNRIEVVDGDLRTSWDPPVNALNFSITLDLQIRRNIHTVRLITRGTTPSQLESNSLRGYSIQISDDQIRWSEVGAQHDVMEFARSEVTFRPTWTRYVRLVIVEINAVSGPRLAEMEVFGAGHSDRGTFLSELIDLGVPDSTKNFGKVSWETTVQERTGLKVQFRTGGAAEDFADLDAGWGDEFETGDIWFPADEPARLFQYRVIMSTRDDTRSPTFQGLRLDYSTSDIAASSALGRVFPNRVPMGRDTTFVYALNLEFSPDDRGVKRIEIDVPTEVRLDVAAIDGLNGTTVESWESTRSKLSIALSEPLSADTQLQIPFQTRTYSTSHEFRAFLFSEGSADPLNVAQNTEVPLAGEPYSWALLASTSSDEALFQTRANPRVFTPNGDGINDDTVIEFILSKVDKPREVAIEIFDLSGRAVLDLAPGLLVAGSYLRLGRSSNLDSPGLWDGKDASRNLVPPGIYLYRVEVDLDTGNEVQTGLVGVAY
jgi:hypothetical protein